MSKTEELKKIRDEVFNLRESSLYEYRVKSGYFPVLGEGSHDAKIMFIGEAPGLNEAKRGRPFCGAAGKVLDELLESIGLPRKDVYITNIVKDRPPGNRDPLPTEIALYAPFLERQIDIIKPKVIAILGRISMGYIFNKFGLADQLETISKMHGKAYDAELPHGKVKIVALYHPAVGVYNPHTKDALKKDFAILKSL
ncbi:MAG: uracil-DNA glycosylase [Candidatus Liptonbacteria bacterium]|nr:uracil-DNA glycosylase [Candidatus Liptonbacteria bacterium]